MTTTTMTTNTDNRTKRIEKVLTDLRVGSVSMIYDIMIWRISNNEYVMGEKSIQRDGKRYGYSEAVAELSSMIEAAKKITAEQRAQQIVEKHGVELCKRAIELNEKSGEGATAIADYLGVSVRDANAMMNAYRLLSE